MSTVSLIFQPSTRAAGERRIAVALAISLIVHTCVLLAIADTKRWWQKTSPLGFGDAVVLQADLRGPETPPVVDKPEVLSAVTEAPSYLEPPAPAKPKPSAPIGGDQTAPTTVAKTTGAPDPPVRITIATVVDPARLGDPQTMDLARSFPAMVGKRPELRGTLTMLYPRQAMDSRRQARISIVLSINERGEIVQQRFLPNDPVFAESIAAALKDAEFSPAELDGQYIPYWAIIQVTFIMPGEPPLPVVANR